MYVPHASIMVISMLMTSNDDQLRLNGVLIRKFQCRELDRQRGAQNIWPSRTGPSCKTRTHQDKLSAKGIILAESEVRRSVLQKHMSI
jgi:hypothetical protein